ncbi:unnamed protein product [Prorocentrum cordatum]|uniref:Uncharacterized protein n=1 Tax=Prorocentrum cordatum TaxID=2364126 RepID=A0ABN9T5B8_9DINO|nr:unnamed protein product [Polarella glacialis]
MALKWAQNHSAVMLVARFAPKWDSPGANLAVHSTERGRGHVDKERTAARIKELLQVSITARRVSADIIAEAGSARKRYRLEAELFDCIPRGAGERGGPGLPKGSMQMSTGAQIPELVLTLRKRWPGPRPWARLTAAAAGAGALAPPWWADAPGLTEQGTAALREHPERGATPPTCGHGGALFCSTLDACVPSCEACQGAGLTRTGEHRCVGHPRAVAARRAAFTDTDLRPASVGGPLRWEYQLGELLDDFVDSFSVQWGASETEALGDSMEASPSTPMTSCRWSSRTARSRPRARAASWCSRSARLAARSCSPRTCRTG